MIQKYSGDVLVQTRAKLEGGVIGVERVSLNIAVDPQVQTVLERIEQGTIADLEKAQLLRKAQHSMAQYGLFQDDIAAAWLFATDGSRIELDKSRLGLGPPSMDASFVSAGLGAPMWSGLDEVRGMLLVGREIRSLEDLRPIGTIILEVPVDDLIDVVAHAQESMGGSLFVVDSSRKVIATDQRQMSSLSELPLGELIGSKKSAGFEQVDYAGEDAYVSTSEPLENGWQIVAILPSREYRSQIFTLGRTVLAVGIGLLFGSIATAGVVASNLSQPISKLSAEMDKFGEGSLEVRSSIQRRDEIGSLARAFNDMADNVVLLMGRVQREQDARRESEIHALRNQLNPHFLYNSLDTINWLARKQGATQAADTVASLAVLLRSAIEAPDNIALKDEIRILEHYVSVEQLRHGDRLSVKYEISPTVENLSVPTFILQPLVENSIIHGVSPSVEPCTVTVRAYERHRGLVIEVEDDGIGFALGRADDTAKKADGDSVGLRNVQRRIAAMSSGLGELTVRSEPGEGAFVSVFLPESVVYKSLNN